MNAEENQIVCDRGLRHVVTGIAITFDCDRMKDSHRIFFVRLRIKEF